MIIYQRPTPQVQTNNKDESKDQKYNTKDRYLLTSVGIKWLLIPKLGNKERWTVQSMLKLCLYSNMIFVQ